MLPVATACSTVFPYATLFRSRVPRYDVVYHLLSIPNRCELRLKVRVGERGEEHPPVPTVVGVWPTANWYEREVYDLFGITDRKSTRLNSSHVSISYAVFCLKQ